MSAEERLDRIMGEIHDAVLDRINQMRPADRGDAFEALRLVSTEGRMPQKCGRCGSVRLCELEGVYPHYRPICRSCQEAA